MKETTKLRLDIEYVEQIQKTANDPGDQMLASVLHESLCKKFIEKMYPQPKEL